MVLIVEIDSGNASLLERCASDVFDERPDPARIAAFVRQPQQILVVACANDEVVGQCLAVIHWHPDKPTELYIDDLGVAPSYHRQGIATQLVKKVIAIGESRGCEEIWVATEPENIAAKSFYSSLGLSSRLATVFEGSLKPEE